MAEVETLDDAFDGVDSSKDNIVEDKIVDEKVTETSEETSEKTWQDYGVDRWDGLSKEQIAREVLHGRSVSGRQADEVGGLRKERDKALSQLNSVKSAAGVEQKVEQKVADMDEFEKERFFKQLEANPSKAIRELVKDGMGIVPKEDIQKLVQDGINEALRDYDGYSQVSGVQRTRPEYIEHEPYIEVLAKAENFGNTRSYEDMLDFSILQKSNTTLGNAVFDLMKRHPSMPFNECKEIAELRMGAKTTNEDNKDNLRQTVKGIEGGVKKGAKKKGSETEKIMTMDDAFGPD